MTGEGIPRFVALPTRLLLWSAVAASALALLPYFAMLSDHVLGGGKGLRQNASTLLSWFAACSLMLGLPLTVLAAGDRITRALARQVLWCLAVGLAAGAPAALLGFTLQAGGYPLMAKAVQALSSGVLLMAWLKLGQVVLRGFRVQMLKG